jgi:hypothetical protein
MGHVVLAAATNHEPAQSVNRDRLGFFRVWEDLKRINHSAPVRFARELWMAGKNEEATMANGNNGNQFRDDEIIILDRLRDGKIVKNIFPKIGGRLRLAHEENDQLSITTEIIKYDENLAVIRAITTTMKGSLQGLAMFAD